MGKVIVLLCFAFLAMTLVMCQEETACEPKPSCTSNDDCCGNWCNPWKSVCATTKGPPWARASPAVSGGAPAVPFLPPWMIGGWPWWKKGPGGWFQGGPQDAGMPWWGQPGIRAAPGAEWAPEEEPAK